MAPDVRAMTTSRIRRVRNHVDVREPMDGDESYVVGLVGREGVLGVASVLG
jgi:hypothetical protein